MELRRQRSRGGRRKRKSRSTAASEPVLIVARRPNSPLIQSETKRRIAASARPKTANASSLERTTEQPSETRGGSKSGAVETRRLARIVQPEERGVGDQEQERERLLQRILNSEGRGAISRAAEEYLNAGFEFPKEQAVQLQLLEHFNEARARKAMEVLTAIVEREEPMKRPVFEQRLRRLEEHADEALTREAAADLRRSIRF